MLEIEHEDIEGPAQDHRTTCNTAVLGPGLTVDGATAGDLLVESGHQIVVLNGVVVEHSGEVTLSIRSDLLP